MLGRLRRVKKNSYWQIEVDERDQEKTAFITLDGLYRFQVMPFGLCMAPAAFQRVMDTVLAELEWQTCLIYLDEVVMFSGAFEEHLQRLTTVLEAIREAGLSLKAEMCCFEFHELKFLVSVVSAAGVRPDAGKTSAVAIFPTLKKEKGVRIFLGL